MDDKIEARFQAMLKRLKANNPDFDRNVERGKLMMRKRADELTDTERAFLDGDAAKMN